MSKENNNQSDDRKDTEAIQAFKDLLTKEEKNIIHKWTREEPCPADIIISFSGNEEELFYFEIKKTKINTDNKSRFGAATLSEWAAAMDNPRRYYFVIAIEKEDNDNTNNKSKGVEDKKKSYVFFIITPEKFLEYSIIPPFKIDFNIPIEQIESGFSFSRPGRNPGSIIMRRRTFKTLSRFWTSIKKQALTKKRQKQQVKNDFYQIKSIEELMKLIKEYKK